MTIMNIMNIMNINNKSFESQVSNLYTSVVSTLPPFLEVAEAQLHLIRYTWAQSQPVFPQTSGVYEQQRKSTR